jgi:hypothetical protein
MTLMKIRREHPGFRRTLQGLACVLMLSGVCAPAADALQKPVAPAPVKKGPVFGPLVSSPDVIALKRTAKELRITGTDGRIRASLKGFPEVTFNDRGYADRLLIRSPGPGGSLDADLDLGCSCGCGGVPKEYAKAGIDGLECDEIASSREHASWRIRWDFAGKNDRILSGAISADRKGEIVTLPVDIVRLDRGTRVAFAVYDPKKGFAGSKQLGETFSVSGRIVVPEFSPAPKEGEFLLAVANFGTDVVRLRGGSDGLRPIFGDPSSPALRTDDSSAIGPGEMAILNLTKVANTSFGVIVHFEGSDVKVTWGLPGIALSPAGLFGIGTFFVGGSMFAVARKRRGATKV